MSVNSKRESSSVAKQTFPTQRGCKAGESVFTEVETDSPLVGIMRFVWQQQYSTGVENPQERSKIGNKKDVDDQLLPTPHNYLQHFKLSQAIN